MVDFAVPMRPSSNYFEPGSSIAKITGESHGVELTIEREKVAEELGWKSGGMAAPDVPGAAALPSVQGQQGAGRAPAAHHR